ncbi:UNVERIFIED_CONTAM: hypothetical protein GTU68_012117 [Idotea baltica]|nr:hypothetical protein [Idotea baltica]
MLADSNNTRPKKRETGGRAVQLFLISLVAVLGFQASILAFIGVPNFSKIFSDIAGQSKASQTQRLQDITAAAAERYRLEPELIWAVIAVESNFNPKAVSRVGAMGLMQLMPATAKELLVVDPWSPEQNIYGGAKYLRHLLDTFDGDMVKAIAAYNAGPGAVRRHRGIPPYKETRNYVKKVIRRYKFEMGKRAPIV